MVSVLLCGPTQWEMVMMVMPILLPVIIFWMAGIAVLTRARQSMSTKFIWVFIITFIPVLGPLAYLIVGRRRNVVSDWCLQISKAKI